MGTIPYKSSVPKSAYHQYASPTLPSNHQLLPDGERAHVCKGSLLQLLHAQVLPIHHLLDQRQQTTSKSLCPTMSCVFTGKRFRCVPDLDEEKDYTDIDFENFDNNKE